jgi:hypothetical protein
MLMTSAPFQIEENEMEQRFDRTLDYVPFCSGGFSF